MRKVALIEDDADLFNLLKYALEREGYLFTGLNTGKGAIEFCRRERPDLLLLDIMLPDCDGLEICRELRRRPDLGSTPVIFLTARASETDRIVGLELGGNDYVVKPFSVRELLARIRVQLRVEHSEFGAPIRAGQLEIDPVRHEVRRNDQPLVLTATEFRLLECLMSRPGLVLSRDQLLDLVWGRDKAVTGRTVDVHVLRLRRKIEPDPARPVFLQSIRGFGYRFLAAGPRAEVA